MTRSRFEELVKDALASIPRRFRAALHNVAIVVEDEPSPALLEEMDIEPPDTLLGLYQGIPLTDRRWDYGNTLPDRVVLFQGPIERDAEDDEDMKIAIAETLIHELGHYFGLSEEEIEEIEERYWKGKMGGDKEEGKRPLFTTIPFVPRTRKRFGQHFLEPVWVSKLINIIAPQPTDTFLEIGPGRGALTLPLAARGGRIVAVEIDRDLAADLTPRLPSNVQLITADVLAVDLKAVFARDIPNVSRLRIVGNLPYNVVAPILFRLLALRRSFGRLTDATVMVQQEVADRLLAEPSSKEYGVLTILVRMLADVTRLLTLPPGAFRPAPKVTSTVVRLAFRSPLVAVLDPPGFEALVRGIFTRRRKTILNALKPLAAAAGVASSEALAKVGIDPSRRPETLEVTELAALADFFAAARK